MKLTELFQQQLDAEADRTRRAIERVPEGRDEYLRLNDVAVPAIYGPSADEASFG